MPKNVLVGICGGIAAYKAVEVVSALRQRGHTVQVTMSKAACEFVTPLTFAGVSGQRVLTDVFPDSDKESGDGLYPHLYPATQADVFLLVPATANMIRRVAHGEGEEIVSLSALSLPAACRRLFAPAMNVEMWEQDAVQDNVRTLEERGWTRIGPEAGSLACGMEGEGRLSDPALIIAEVEKALKQMSALKGTRCLITSGPTHEYLDPVRFLGNASSGRMGKALAEAAADRGAKVTFVTGPVHSSLLPRRPGITIIPVTSAEEMLEASKKPFAKCKWALFAAAIADYKPVTRAHTKAGKKNGAWSLRLESTPDIAAELCEGKKKSQRALGFALQTGTGLTEAMRKCEVKNLDAVVLNHPEALNADEGTYTLITPDREPEPWGTLSKRVCADRIFDTLTALRKK